MNSKYVGLLCSRIFFCLCFSIALFTHHISFFSVCLSLFYHHWPSFTLSLICMSSVRHPSKPTTAFLPFAFFHVLFLHFSFYRKLISSQSSMRENLTPVFFFSFLWSIHAFAPLWVPLGTTPFYLQPRAQPLQCIPVCAIPSNQRFLFLQPNCVSFFQEWETCDWFCMYSLCRVWGRSDGSNWGSFVRQCGG